VADFTIFLFTNSYCDHMNFRLITFLLLFISLKSYSQEAEKNIIDKLFPETPDSIPQKTPFGFGDFTWMNAYDRTHSSILASKYVKGSFCFDGYYNYSFHNPIDNTTTGSTVTGRHNEFTINLASIGGEVNYKNVRGALYLQAGSMVNTIQSQDPTAGHGQFTDPSAYKYIREATGGYHWNKWYGINLDIGIFMSFIGLESYLTAENWCYQRSFVSDFTPFYFKGARLQTFPTEHLKVDLWFMNGWQSYSKANGGTSIGYSVYYSPLESVRWIANGYYGRDTKGNPDVNRIFLDQSFLIRYYNQPGKNSFSRGALSLTADYSFETGGGFDPGYSYFASFMAANRLNFLKNKIGLSQRFGIIKNPSRYLALTPAGPLGYTDDFSKELIAYDVTFTFDIMPNDYLTLRAEFINRNASIPYFAGPGGVTSPSGYQQPIPAGWSPDLKEYENRLIFAIDVRF
jgi:hypothetical protein